MSDLISRDRLLRDIYFQEGRYPETPLMRMAIMEQPAVDAVEVVHGRWLLAYKGQCTSAYECSNCRRTVTITCDEELRKRLLVKKYPFCHCGAKMDGEMNAE